ncbi:hypothetical protein CBL_10603 [Carabus blaptoides fortunei]
MPVIDDLNFLAKSLKEKLVRLDEVAVRVEQGPQNKKDLALFRVMTEGMDEISERYHETVMKIAAYNAKQTPRIEEDWQDEIVQFENLFYNAKAIASIAFPDADKLNVSLTPGQAMHANPSHVHGVSLPKLKLVEFSGEVKSWNNFSDLYLATVHNNTQLSDVQKHMYLRSSVKGDALSLISSLPLTADNYQVAWNTLQTRYNNTTLLRNAYLEALFGVPNATRQPQSTRALATSLAEYLGALQALGHNVEGWAVPLIFIFSNKLNAVLREHWEKSKMN